MDKNISKVFIIKIFHFNVISNELGKTLFPGLLVTGFKQRFTRKECLSRQISLLVTLSLFFWLGAARNLTFSYRCTCNWLQTTYCESSFLLHGDFFLIFPSILSSYFSNKWNLVPSVTSRQHLDNLRTRPTDKLKLQKCTFIILNSFLRMIEIADFFLWRRGKWWNNPLCCHQCDEISYLWRTLKGK